MLTNLTAVQADLTDLGEQIALAMWAERTMQDTGPRWPERPGNFVATPHVVDAPAVGTTKPRAVLVELVRVEPVDESGRRVPGRAFTPTGPCFWADEGRWKVSYTSTYRTGALIHWVANGEFHVQVGGGPVSLPPASVHCEAGPPPATAKRRADLPAPDRFPQNVAVDAVLPHDHDRLRLEVTRVAATATHRLVTAEKNVLWGLNKVVAKGAHRLVETAAMAIEDYEQIYLAKVVESMRAHASYDRSATTWSNIVKFNCVREPKREYERARFEPAMIQQIRDWISGHNLGAKTPEEIIEYRARHLVANEYAERHGVSHADALAATEGDDAPRARVRWKIDQIERALVGTTVVSTDLVVEDGPATLGDLLEGTERSDGGYAEVADTLAAWDVDVTADDLATWPDTAAVVELAGEMGIHPGLVLALALSSRRVRAEQYAPGLVDAAARFRSDRRAMARIKAQVDDIASAAFTPTGAGAGVYRDFGRIGRAFQDA